MALVAGLALAIPWWEWHVEMLKRSERYLHEASFADGVVANSEDIAPVCRASIAHLVHRRLAVRLAWVPPDDSLAEVLEMLAGCELDASQYRQYAVSCRRAVTFPWLDVESPYEPTGNAEDGALTLPAPPVDKVAALERAELDEVPAPPRLLGRD